MIICDVFSATKVAILSQDTINKHALIPFFFKHTVNSLHSTCISINYRSYYLGLIIRPSAVIDTAIYEAVNNTHILNRIDICAESHGCITSYKINSISALYHYTLTVARYVFNEHAATIRT